MSAVIATLMNEPNDQTSPFVTVQFTEVEEFLEELRKSKIEPVLRVTKIFTQSKNMPLRYVSVEAAALSPGEIPKCIKISVQCGEIFGNHVGGELSQRAIQRAEMVQKRIEAGAAALKLEVRAGMYR